MLTLKEIIELEKTLYFKNYEEQYFSRVYKDNWYKNNSQTIDLTGIKENNISYDEAFFIYLYTGFASRNLNTALYNEDLDDIQLSFAENLDLILKKIKTVNNTLLYHIDEFTCDEKIEWLYKNKNKIIQINWFLSTSFDLYNNEEVSWHIKTHKTNSKSHDISNITNNRFEKEVLFERNCNFEIINVYKNNDVYNIFLEEVFEEKFDFCFNKIIY